MSLFIAILVFIILVIILMAYFSSKIDQDIAQEKLEIAKARASQFKSVDFLKNQLKKEYSDNGYLHYFLNKKFYIVIGLHNNLFIGYILKSNTKKKFAKFKLDETDTVETIEIYNSYNTNLTYEDISSVTGTFEIYSLFKEIKKKNYNLKSLYFNPAELNNSKIYGESYIYNKYVNSDVLIYFKNNSLKSISQFLENNNILSKEELLLIDKYYEKLETSDFSRDDAIYMDAFFLSRKYLYLKDIPKNLSYEFKDFGTFLPLGYKSPIFELSKLINISSNNEFEFDFVIIYMYMRVMQHEDIVKIFTSTFSIDTVENQKINKIIRNIIEYDSINSEYYLLAISLLRARPDKLIEDFNLLSKQYEQIEETMELEKIKEDLLSSNQIKEEKLYLDKILSNVDYMDGYQFEKFVANLYKKLGYKASVTKSSGDQGVDVIVTDDLGNKTGVQTKRSATKVTNRAVQEIYSGINYYGCSDGIVITNNYFTPSAISLASKNSIKIINRIGLIELIKDAHKESNLS